MLNVEVFPGVDRKRCIVWGLGLMLPPAAAIGLSLAPHVVVLLTIASLAIGAVFYLSPESRKKPTLKYALVIMAICVPILSLNADALPIIDAATRFSAVMGLLFGVALLRNSLARSGLATLISRQLISAAPGSENSKRVSLASAFLTIFSGQGSIAIICASLAQKVQDKLAVARISARALCASMYILPTTIASAAVASAIPGLDPKTVLVYGSPLMVLALLGSMAPKLEILPQEGEAVEPLKFNAFLLAGFVISVGIVYFVIIGRMTETFCLAMISGYLFEVLVLSKNRSLPAIRKEVEKSLDGILPEILLLSASGLLIFTIASSGVISNMPAQLVDLLSNEVVSLLFLVVALPLVTIAGVHPLILFGIFFPVISAATVSALHIQYLAWTSMFVMANLLSPVSICSIVAATSLQTNSVQTSYVSHWRFCAAMMAFTVPYLLLLHWSSTP